MMNDSGGSWTVNRPMVFYGPEPWAILAEYANAPGVFERHMLRSIFGGVFEHVVCRKRMNLRACCPVPSIMTAMKAML